MLTLAAGGCSGNRGWRRSSGANASVIGWDVGDWSDGERESRPGLYTSRRVGDFVVHTELMALAMKTVPG